MLCIAVSFRWLTAKNGDSPSEPMHPQGRNRVEDRASGCLGEGLS
jgi:hypothetical protein